MGVQRDAHDFSPWGADVAAPALKNLLVIAVIGQDGGDFQRTAAEVAGQVFWVGAVCGVHWGTVSVTTSNKRSSVTGTRAKDDAQSGHW